MNTEIFHTSYEDTIIPISEKKELTKIVLPNKNCLWDIYLCVDVFEIERIEFPGKKISASGADNYLSCDIFLEKKERYNIKDCKNKRWSVKICEGDPLENRTINLVAEPKIVTYENRGLLTVYLGNPRSVFDGCFIRCTGFTSNTKLFNELLDPEIIVDKICKPTHIKAIKVKMDIVAKKVCEW